MEYSLTPPTTDIDRMINDKHHEYLKKARLYSKLYYTTRILAGVSAAILPFIIGKSQTWATILAIIIAVLTVFDSVFSPKDKWVLYSKATDMLSLAMMKARGEYEMNKEIVDVILQTETGNLQQLVGLQELLERVEKQARSK